MSRTDRFLERVSRRLPVMLHLPGYMNRWWLLPRFLLKVGPEGHLVPRRFVPDIRLHQILRSDNDRHNHDHPRASVACILAGGYTEIVQTGRLAFGSVVVSHKVWRGPGSITYRPADHLHRLQLPAGKTSWSIFILFGPKRDWGYDTPDGWIHNRKYSAYRRGEFTP